MQSDVFEDFASDDGFESDFDENNDDTEFNDEQLANVLDLMAESSMTRLNAVFQEDTADDLKGGGKQAGVVADTKSIDKFVNEMEGDVSSRDTRLERFARSDERARENRDELLSPVAAPSTVPEASSMLSLLEELLSPPPRSASDSLVASTEDEAKSLVQKEHKQHVREGNISPDRHSEWLSSLDDTCSSSAEAQSPPPPSSVTAVAPSPATAVGRMAPTLQGEAKPNEQPEWMRILLDDMLAGSTKSPCLSPIAEVRDQSTDELQVQAHSRKQPSAAKSSPAETQQPSWMSLLDELYPSSTEAQSPTAAMRSSEVPGIIQENDQEVREKETEPPRIIVEMRKPEHVDRDSAQDPTMSTLRLESAQLPERDHQYGESSISTSLDGTLNSSPLLSWGRFSPDRMPVRHASEMLGLVKAGSKRQTKSSSCKKLCYVPLSRSQKWCRVHSRVITPAESELTFRPKINSRYLKRLRTRRQALTDAFSRRMESDIQQRHERKIKREKEKDAKTKVEENAQLAPKSLIAKGSEKILQRNGLWEESLEKRLKRLMHGQSGAEAPQRSHKESEKSRSRRQKRKQRAEAVASQACESLYQRGLDKKRRDQKRQQETSKSLKRVSARPKMTLQSQLVMKKKLRHELELVCGSRYCRSASSQQRSTTPRSDAEEEEEPSSQGKVEWVSFVEFSCALLYFGLVPDLETPWKGDEKVTLLWYVWRTFVNEQREEDSSEQEEEMLPMSTLESILGAVMLGEKETTGRQYQHFVPKKGNELFQVLRLHYLSRKRFQTLEVRKMDNLSSNSVNNVRKPESSRVNRSVPAKYTLHGKPMTRDGSGGYDPLAQRQRATAAKLNELRRQKEEQEVAECTFQPRITESRAQSSEWSCELRLLSVYGRQYKTVGSATKTTFDRLYNDAFQRQNNVLEKYFQAKLEEDEQFKKEAGISPSYVNGLTVEERLRNLQAALANNPLPVNFYKKIDAMRSATELKVQESEAKAKRLLPIQFQKSEDGRTIVVPFQFATGLRRNAAGGIASQVASDRQRSGNSSSSGLDRELRKKTRALVQSAINKLRSENKVIGPEHEADVGIRGGQQQQQHQQEEDEAAGFCLDVHLSPSEVRQLHFNVNDDPTLVSAAFAKRHGLHKEQERCLIGVIEANLEKLLDLQL